MPQYDAEKLRKLKNQITMAFQDVPYPGDDNLVDRDPGGYNYEQNDLEDTFRGKHWQGLTLAVLHNSASSFFTPEAFHFFLPAYLIVSIDSFYDADVIPINIVYDLDPIFNAECGCTEKFENILDRFTLAQRSAIRSFLQFLDDEHGDEYDDCRLDYLIEFYRVQ